MADDDGDYVLGTRDAEIARLGLQHRVWRETMLGAWRRAGLREGWRVVDAGAGPGYAALELAELVGPAGQVLAVERSARFAAVLRQEAERRRFSHLSVVEGDLMAVAPVSGFDLAWCRWVAAFVPSVPTLCGWLAGAVRTGGRVVMHEYADYGSWRYAPPRPRLEEFVTEVMANWRASGGEPNIAPALVGALRAAGFRITAARTHAFVATPDEMTWQWPASFVETHVTRLRELGRVTAEWGDAVLEELADAERDRESLVVTPLVLEIIAERV